MITPQHGKETTRVGILALLYVFNPGSESPERHFVFGFAGDGAGVTADAFAMVYDEAVFHLLDGATLHQSGKLVRDRRKINQL